MLLNSKNWWWLEGNVVGSLEQTGFFFFFFLEIKHNVLVITYLVYKHSTNSASYQTFWIQSVKISFCWALISNFIMETNGNVRFILHELVLQPHFWKHISSTKKKNFTYCNNLLYAMWMILSLLCLMKFPIIYLSVGYRY